MTFARECWPFVLPFALGALILALFGRPVGAGVVAVLGLGVLLFFRNPSRSYSGPEEIVLAAADGVVTVVDEVEDPDVAPGRRRRVVTFLSVFDVHVQRAPNSGRVVASRLFRGAKVAAFREDAGRVNEQQLTVFEGSDGVRVGVRQIAGLLARRVVGYLREGDQARRGDLMGVIKFGSRVDVVLPLGYEILVKKGDRLRCGETPIARPAGMAAAP